MAKIYNSEVTKQLANTCGIQQSRERTPDELAEKIVPVIETNPELFRKDVPLNFATQIATGNITALSTTLNPITKKTFITGIYAAFSKNAACDVASGTLNVTLTPKGKASSTVLYFPVITLTQERDNIFIQFKNPIEIEPATSMSMTGTFAAGELSRGIAVFGYQIENINI